MMANNPSGKLANLRMLQNVAHQLQALREQVVFLGGCTTAIFITDQAAPDVRYTLDVDCIVDVISSAHYHQLEKQLRAYGFKQSMDDEVICRWHYEDMIVDIMPTDEKILGFSNRWYKQAIVFAQDYYFPNQLSVKVTTAPYFLATKLEAFKGRGNRDYFASHDFEDIVSVMDGRVELMEELAQADLAVRDYLSDAFAEIITHRGFHDALPGHLNQYGRLADERAELLLSRLNDIIHSDREGK